MNKKYHSFRQSGAVLMVSLIMLVLMTLFAISAITSSTVNLRITGNMQAQDEARAAAQQAIERVITTYANFYPTPTAQSVTVDLNNDGTTDYTVSVAAPSCRRASQQIPPKSTQCANGARGGLFCWDTLWDVTATATDAASGASQKVTQGVSITLGPAFVPSSVGC